MMSRTLLCATMLLVTVTAANAARARHEPLPLPPTPPAAGPPGSTAPTPDLAAQLPRGDDEGNGPVLVPAWFAARPYSPSEGFLPGSHVSARPDGRTEIAPGVNIRFPLR